MTASAQSAGRQLRPTFSKTTSDTLLPWERYVWTSSQTQAESYILIPGLRGLTSLQARSFHWQEALGIILKDSESESMFCSDLKNGAMDESLPIHITSWLRWRKLSQNNMSPPKTYKKCQPKLCGPIYWRQPWHWSQSVCTVQGELQGKSSLLNKHLRSLWLIAHDFIIPFDIEGCFCWGLYHIASLSRLKPHLPSWLNFVPFSHGKPHYLEVRDVLG